MVIQNIYEYYGSKFPPSIGPLAGALLKKLQEGSICIHLENLDSKEYSMLNVSDFRKTLTELENANLLSINQAEPQAPFVLFEDRLYMQRYFQYEAAIAQKIKKFSELAEVKFDERYQQLNESIAFIKTYIWNNNSPAPDFQTVAAILGFLNQFTIVTGGPGVGKTTSTKKLLALLLHLNPDIRIAICAPTGKAAQRMKETLSEQALSDLPSAIAENISRFSEKSVTIHSLLGSKIIKENSPYFKHDHENPLPFDVIVVDESSMIDVALFAKLLDAISPECRLIMLGDKDQLASVEAASIFGDICIASSPLNQFDKKLTTTLNNLLSTKHQLNESFNNENLLHQNIVELKHSHRFSSDKGIGKLSKAVIQADEISFDSFLENNDEEVTIQADLSDTCFRNFISGYKFYIEFLLENGSSKDNIRTALELLNKNRVLVAVREGADGLYAINKKIEQYLEINIHFKGGSSSVASLHHFKTNAEFYPCRPIMVTKNNYSVSPILYNGDIGIIFPDADGITKAWFEKDGEIVGYPCGLLANIETNFAQTIHKSQGSEYENILIILPKTIHQNILTRELLYTGITRAKKHVTIISNNEILKHTIQNKIQRQSGIAYQLKK